MPRIILAILHPVFQQELGQLQFALSLQQHPSIQQAKPFAIILLQQLPLAVQRKPAVVTTVLPIAGDHLPMPILLLSVVLRQQLICHPQH